jgi:hypothetical protein
MPLEALMYNLKRRIKIKLLELTVMPPPPQKTVYNYVLKSASGNEMLHK